MIKTFSAQGRTALVGLVTLIAAGCGHTQRTVISLQDIDCASCGVNAVAALEKHAQITDATFNRDLAEVSVQHDAALPPTALVRVAEKAGYRAVIGAGRGQYIDESPFDDKLDVAWLTRDGSAVDLAAHAVPGKVTVFDFYARWCGPCKKVDAAMADTLAQRPDVALRKLNVVSWDTPLAKQHLRTAKELPYVIVVGPDGAQVDVISGLHLDRLSAAIQKAATP